MIILISIILYNYLLTTNVVLCSNCVSNLKGIFLTFNIYQSKIDAVNVTQNTGTTKRLTKTTATLLHLFNTSYINTLHLKTNLQHVLLTLLQIYILEIPGLQVWIWLSMLMITTYVVKKIIQADTQRLTFLRQ